MWDKALLDRAFGLLPGDVAGGPVADVEPQAAAASGKHFRQQAAIVVEDAVRRRRIHVRDDVAALEQREDFGQRRVRLSQMDHDRQIERLRYRLRTPERFEIVL